MLKQADYNRKLVYLVIKFKCTFPKNFSNIIIHFI